MRLIALLAAIIAGATSIGAAPLCAQDPALVEVVAPLLQAEDAREWRPERFRAGLESPEALVRRTAALAVGRVGDLRGTALLLPLLQDPDSSVQPIAAFALGLLRDTAAVSPLIARLGSLPAPSLATAEEIITALARIGGSTAAGAIAGILDNSLAVSVTEYRDVLVRQAALEAWRLGAAGPARQLVALAQSEDEELRWRVVYSLGRLRTREGGDVLVAALTDANGHARAFAARALTMSGAEAMAVPPEAAVDLLSRAAQDDLPGVRINALRSLGSFRRPALAERLAAAMSAGRAPWRSSPGLPASERGASPCSARRSSGWRGAAPIPLPRWSAPGRPARGGRNGPRRRKAGAGSGERAGGSVRCERYSRIAMDGSSQPACRAGRMP